MEPENIKKTVCCQLNSEYKLNKKGLLAGLIYGLLPHSFCIAFIVFSVIGAAGGALFFKKFLLIPYFFHFLVLISLVFATISALFYLKKNNFLSFNGIKRKWKYLAVLYGTTVFINLLFFFVIFPAAANINTDVKSSKISVQSKLDLDNKNPYSYSFMTLGVEIPCPGHAPLIISELNKLDGINEVKFKLPNLFSITYDPAWVSIEKTLSLEIFKTFKATVINYE